MPDDLTITEPQTDHKQAANGTTPAEHLSIQRRAQSHLAAGGGSLPAVWWIGHPNTVSSDVAPWWSERRDRDLRLFVLKPGNDILQGALASMIKKFRAMDWSITGPKRVVNKYQTMLSESEFGQGWPTLLGKGLYDYHTQDKGWFTELIGAGDPDGPLVGPVVGLAHLDAQYCQLTGDPIWPVLFNNAKDNKSHRLHASRVMHITDLPSPVEPMFGVGFCATSRVLASSSVLLKLARYKNEKLDDLPEAGVAIFNNILKDTFDDAEANFSRERRAQGQMIYTNILRLFNLDPAKEASINFTSFANLPDAFNEKEATELYINIVALAFGVDVREFWPMSAGSLGSASESLMQHQKAKGKGIGDLISTIERAINWMVLPPSVEFHFDFQDDEEDEARARINQTKAATITGLNIATSEGDLFTRAELRQMLAANVDYVPPEFLDADTGNDMSDDLELFDTEREAKAFKEYYGPVVTIDSRGRLKRVPRKQHGVVILPDLRETV